MHAQCTLRGARYAVHATQCTALPRSTNPLDLGYLSRAHALCTCNPAAARALPPLIPHARCTKHTAAARPQIGLLPALCRLVRVNPHTHPHTHPNPNPNPNRNPNVEAVELAWLGLGLGC